MHYHSSFYRHCSGGDATSCNQSSFSDIDDLEQSSGFRHVDAAEQSTSPSMLCMKPSSVPGASASQFRSLNAGLTGAPEVAANTLQPSVFQRGAPVMALPHPQFPLHNSRFQNWPHSVAIADHTHHMEADDQTNRFQSKIVQPDIHSSFGFKGKSRDHKILRRLAQNREAARKSRMRKKAYVQQLENSRTKLAQLEQEIQRTRQHQGILFATGFSGDQSHSLGGNGALAFDMDYARWVDEHEALIDDLRSATNCQAGDNELRVVVDSVMAHYDKMFRLKSLGAKTDVFHMLSGMWKTPVERFFMWLGGFRSSELLKILGTHLEALTDEQLVGICNLQQSCQQAEDALSQGMDALQQSLLETLSSSSLGPTGCGNVAEYMAQMGIAMGKLATVENFVHQGDLLRQQTLQQMHRILTTEQAARALVVIGDYVSRMRALSSLWFACPRD